MDSSDCDGIRALTNGFARGNETILRHSQGSEKIDTEDVEVDCQGRAQSGLGNFECCQSSSMRLSKKKVKTDED